MTIQYERKSSAERKEDILKALVGERWITAGRVGRLVGLSRAMAYKYLCEMEKSGLLMSRSVGEGLTGSTRYCLYEDTEQDAMQKYYHVRRERF